MSDIDEIRARHEADANMYRDRKHDSAHTDRATLLCALAAAEARAEAAEAAIKIQAAAVKGLQACEEREINVLRSNATAAHRATATLDSERAMNAILTEENERLKVVLQELYDASCVIIDALDDLPEIEEGQAEKFEDALHEAQAALREATDV